MCFFKHFGNKFKNSTGEEADKFHKKSMYCLGITTGCVFILLFTTSTIDDRPAYHYPIVDRIDIKDQYEYVDVWEDPKTECHYLIHKTRVSSSKMEIRLLANGKPDCPENR